MEEREEESGRVGGGEWRRVMRRVEEREEESEGELRRVRLPMSFSSHDNKKIWAVGGDSSVPNTTDPVTTEQEEKIISALLRSFS